MLKELKYIKYKVDDDKKYVLKYLTTVCPLCKLYTKYCIK